MISRAQLIWLMAVLTASDVLLGSICFAWLPARSPAHWNFYGEVDRYASRFEVAMLLPIVTIYMAGIFVLADFSTTGRAQEQFRSILFRLAIVILGMIIISHATLLLNALGLPIDVPLVFLVVFGLAEIMVGIGLGKIPRGPIAEVPTPPTLEREAGCRPPPPIGSRLLVAHGLAMVLAAFLCPVWAVTLLLIGGIGALILSAMIYSWLARRKTAAQKLDH